MKKLTKSSKDINISGVCAGVAEYLRINSIWIRSAFTLATILTGFFPGVIIYILLIRIMPEDPLKNSTVHSRNLKKKHFKDTPIIPHG